MIAEDRENVEPERPVRPVLVALLDDDLGQADAEEGEDQRVEPVPARERPEPSSRSGLKVTRRCGRPPRPRGRFCVSSARTSVDSPPMRAGLFRALSADLRAFAGPAARAPDRAPRRRDDLGEARRRLLRPRLRREQDAQARVPPRGRDRQGLRHARLDRRRPVEPHAPGRGRGRARRARLRARPGELGRLAGRRLRQGREHPPQPDHGRGRPARAVRLRHRVQGELGAGARRRRGARRQALRDPGRRLRPPARRARLRALGAGGRARRSRSSASSSTR